MSSKSKTAFLIYSEVLFFCIQLSFIIKYGNEIV